MAADSGVLLRAVRHLIGLAATEWAGPPVHGQNIVRQEVT